MASVTKFMLELQLKAEMGLMASFDDKSSPLLDAKWVPGMDES
jgi:hypothetical protein